MTLVEISNVEKTYRTHRSGRATEQVVAVDSVSFEIEAHSTFGLLGESGSGKSTLGRLVLGIERPTAGRILFRGKDLSTFGRAEAKVFRREAQIVFQNPYASLPPRMRVRRIVEEPLRIHHVGSAADRPDQARSLLRSVGLSGRHDDAYPHELSGGQRQRVVIARALALDPDLIVCDEPVSSLDVSVQATILNLLVDLQNRLGLTYLFISHDLHVVRHVADQIGVMFHGSIVELGSADAIYEEPLHPYTWQLLSAVPSVATERRATPVVTPDQTVVSPSVAEPGLGCKFAYRCPLVAERCITERPALRKIGSGRSAACHFAEDVPEALRIGHVSDAEPSS